MIERHDENYGPRTLGLVLGFMGLTIPFMIYLSTQSYGDESDKHLTTAGWIAFVGFFVSVIVALLLVHLFCRGYRCRLCGRKLPPIPFDQTPKREHRFHCIHCDVVWTTDVFDES